MAEHVGVSGEGREDVDEPEELGLERWVAHGPGEHPLAPPRQVKDAGPLAGAELGDAAGQRAGIGIEPGIARRRHMITVPGPD